MNYTKEDYLEGAKRASAAGDEESARELRNAAALAPSGNPPGSEGLVAGDMNKTVMAPTMGPSGISMQPVTVPRTSEEMARQRADNIQREFSLKEPVVPAGQESASLSTRMMRGFAPTQEDYQKFLNFEYGQGNWIPIGNERNLIRVGSGTDTRWVLDNPTGLDAGDIAELTGQLPQLGTAIMAGLAVAPGPIGTTAKLAQVSGASAASAAIMGAVQDSLFRFAIREPVNASEIAARRGAQAGIDFATGMLPAYAGKVALRAEQSKAINSYLKAFDAEGKQATDFIKSKGINVATSADLGQAIRQFSPAAKSTAEVGDDIVRFVNQGDEALRQQAMGLSDKAQVDASNRALAAISNGTSSVRLTPVEVGTNAMTGADNLVKSHRASLDVLRQEAYKQIESDVQALGGGPYIIQLNNVNSTLKELKGASLERFNVEANKRERIPLAGEVEGLMKRLAEAGNLPQKLEAARAERTRLGEYINGVTPLPPGMSIGVAKKLYASLSQDIDASVATYSGPGAAQLKAYNASYKQFFDALESSPFAHKVAVGFYKNPEALVDGFLSAGSTDYKIAEQIIPPKTFAELKRTAVEKLMGDSSMTLMGTPAANIPKLVQSLDKMDPTVRNNLIGGSSVFNALKQIDREYSYLSDYNGLFAKQSMPSMDEVQQAIDMVKRGGLDKANPFLRQATQAAQARRNGLGRSIVDLTKSGNATYATANPEAVLDAVVFNSKIAPREVNDFVASLPPDLRRDLGDRAFQEVFNKARSDISSHIAKTRETYNVDAVVKSVFGDKQRVDVMRNVLGEDRLKLLDAWVRWDTKLAFEQKRKGFTRQKILSLAAVAPYPNLLAARLTAAGLESAAGTAFLKGANPANVVAFPQARRILHAPTKTGADIAILQRAINDGGKAMFDNYNEMMDGMDPNQQQAVEDYLFGPRN